VAGAGADFPFRVGCGTDLHPLGAGRRLVLGGVTIEHDRGLVGHSDADVLAHAVCDAVLGALGLPDLGTRCPDSDERNRDRSSLTFLEAAGREMRRLGFAVANIDAVVLAEEPSLAPHLETMRTRLAAALGCRPSAIGVKAKRCEGVGAIGRREGMLAQAVALLARVGGRSGGRAGGRGGRPAGGPAGRRPVTARRRRR
jgi:2-C-methyl-D-erythritol 2,4-cyclodiphosphate synthase